ncbi:MAG: periplasmic heavy metal sensor [Chitinophagaceae bacterium]
MNQISKQRWMVLVLLLLLATNLATLVYLWLPAKQPAIPPGRNAFDILVKELKMTEAQQAAYATMRDEQQAAVRPLREQMKETKDQLFALLNNDTVGPATVEAAAAKSAAVQQQLDLANFNHFKKLRAICTPAQQEKFDQIIQDVVRQMGPRPGRGPGRRPDGPLPGGPGNHPPRDGGGGPPPNSPPPDGPPQE